MDKMNEYKIATAYENQKLCEIVNHKLTQGWILLGGVTVTSIQESKNGEISSQLVYSQAMVKYQ
jgi:hypothetical protein